MIRHFCVSRLTAPILAALALVAANMLWGASIAGGKVALDHLPPMVLAEVRCLVALAVLLPLLWLRGERPVLGRSSALMGLTGVAVFFLCYNLGLQSTSATNATLILDGGEPILTALLAVVLLRERPGGRALTGIVAALTGMVAVVLVGHGTPTAGSHLVGDLLMLGSALAWAAYTVLGRRAFAEAGLLAVVAGATLWGALLLLPAAALEVVFVGVGPVGASELALIAYLGAGCSALAYVLLGYGLRHLEATRAGAFGYLAPVTGLGAAVLVLGESVGPGQVTGAILIVAGVWWASTRGAVGAPVADPAVTAVPAGD